MKKPFCEFPFNRLRVTSEGEVYMCCFQRERPLGNLHEKSIDEIWFSPLAEEIRKETLQGRIHSRCRVIDCPHLHNQLHEAEPRKSKYPEYLEIDLPNTHCNIGGFKPSEKNPPCLMCDRSRPAFKLHTGDGLPRILPKLKPLLPGLIGIHIQGIAEAFWHDYLFRVLDLLEFDAHASHIQVSTYTNGIPLSQERRKRFLERCPRSFVTFSLDAATPETYRKLRRLDAYDRVVEHLMAYSEEKKGLPFARLGIHNNINLLNLHEVEGMVRTAAAAKADYIDFDPTTGWCKDIIVNETNYPMFQDAARRIQAEATRLGIQVEFTRPFDLGYASGAGGSKKLGNVVRGYVDYVTPEWLHGWAWDPKLGSEPLTLEIFEGDKAFLDLKADQFREDLANDGIGKGFHAFKLPVPPEMRQSKDSLFHVRVKGSDFELVNSPFRFQPASDTLT
jgi:radical SAM protein with 4Fe4S-binding SPASM domain